ncbi:hypothetical protein CK203_036541 [Vitis vinifera]|uniref:Tify domain-containing protein n=1 Tax=Vitis vinifera TaxID=29760 RepID=A0A438HZP6_VITVI|nr:hypothetical protein CK203_036541 [Vitis vinifera]
MKSRNCNLELSLLPSTAYRHKMMMEMGRGSPQEQQQQQQLTIFYDGRVCVCEVTELQRSGDENPNCLRRDHGLAISAIPAVQPYWPFNEEIAAKLPPEAKKIGLKPPPHTVISLFSDITIQRL